MAQQIWRSILGLIVAVLVGVVATGAGLAMNFGAANLDRGPIRARVLEAFATGELTADMVVPSERLALRGTHQFTDCLIMFEVLRTKGSALERTLSPEQPTAQNPCEALLAEAKGEPVETKRYHRYPHGPVVAAAAGLEVFSLRKVRSAFAAFALLATAGLVAAAALRRNLPIAVAGCAFLLFYGFSSFSMSFAHFPSDMLLIAYLWVALLARIDRWQTRTSAAFHSAFGVATAWFETLNGAAPLGACLILYCAAQGYDPWRAARSLAAYVTGFATAFIVKMAVTASVFGETAMASFNSGLGKRVAGGSGDSLLEALRNLWWHAHVVGGGWRELGRALIAGSILALVYALVVLIRRKAFDVRAQLLLAAFACVPAWHLIFYPHSSMHAWFMVRTMVGLMFPAALLFLIASRARP